jgi:hypothetical protein
MGAHLYLTGRALAVYRGEPLAPLAGKFAQIRDGLAGSSNMIALAVTTEFARKPGVASRRRVDQWLNDQERDGLWCASGRCEQLAPSGHGGMHLLALQVLLEVGYPGAVASRAIALAGKVVRLLRLLSTPDHAFAGPGMRADDGAYNGFATEYDAWLRAALGEPHRGAGGRPRDLVGERNSLVTDTDDLTPANAWNYLPAIWLEELIAAGKVDRCALVEGDSLPALRLPVTVHRWAGGHIASMADPGADQRERYRTAGSAQANREGEADEVTSWVRCEYRTPGKHKFDFGLTWQTTPPAPPKSATTFEIGRRA